MVRALSPSIALAPATAAPALAAYNDHALKRWASDHENNAGFNAGLCGGHIIAVRETCDGILFCIPHRATGSRVLASHSWHFAPNLSTDMQERSPMHPLATAGLFFATAVAEIAGCYLPYLWLRKDAPTWVLIPGALSLALFVWLLSLHPTAAGRVYAAYGGVYVATALGWLWAVDGVRPDRWDAVGALVAIAGMGIIMFAPRG